MAISRRTARLALIAAATLSAPSLAGAIDLEGTWALKLKCTQNGPGFPIERQKFEGILRIGQNGEAIDAELEGNAFAFGRVIADAATPTKGMLSLIGCRPNAVAPNLTSLAAEAKATDDGKGTFKGSLTIAQPTLVSLCSVEAKRIGPGLPTSPSCAPDTE